MRSRTKRDLSKIRTTLRVREAARKLFEENGYDGTTMRDIAREAGMSTGAIFANYPGKDDLYEVIYGHRPFTAEQGTAMAHTLLGLVRNRGDIALAQTAHPNFGPLLEALLDSATMLTRGLPDHFPEPTPTPEEPSCPT